MYATVDLSLWTLSRFCFKVQDHIGNLVGEHFNDDFEVVMRDPILFGDFRLALQEGEPRIYEDIQDYEAAKALFEVWTSVSSSQDNTHPVWGVFGISSGSLVCNGPWLALAG